MRHPSGPELRRKGRLLRDADGVRNSINTWACRSMGSKKGNGSGPSCPDGAPTPEGACGWVTPRGGQEDAATDTRVSSTGLVAASRVLTDVIGCEDADTVSSSPRCTAISGRPRGDPERGGMRMTPAATDASVVTWREDKVATNAINVTANVSRAPAARPRPPNAATVVIGIRERRRRRSPRWLDGGREERGKGRSKTESVAITM